ncbi:hypothetical protein GCM10016234_11990 [Tianweitania populi]|uniref:Uncharacterized protein n=1 Tax=Tianweitania populi TaxID=1607949 RepID=A0A8J3GJ16_9HYPH|nr:hypothetical protein GCM10016234_11990 [Tianweitania populi]
MMLKVALDAERDFASGDLELRPLMQFGGTENMIVFHIGNDRCTFTKAAIRIGGDKAFRRSTIEPVMPAFAIQTQQMLLEPATIRRPQLAYHARKG